jgi:hypothetical protein
LIPNTNGRISNDDQHVIRHLQSGHTSKGSIINEERHEVFLQVLVSDQNSEIQDLSENHLCLQDTFKMTMNRSSQQNFRKLYSTPKPVVKMKPNKLLAARIITSIHTRRGRVVKLKSTRYQLDVDILMKRNFDSHIRKQCIQDDSISYKDFHKDTSPRDKDAMPPHSVIIKHPSKSRKLNGASKIFPDLFDLSKYTLITTIHFIIDDVEVSQSLQPIGSKMFGVPYCLTLKLNSKH